MSHLNIRDYRIVEDIPMTKAPHEGPAAYILYSTLSPLYYIGSTNNLKKRLYSHSSAFRTGSDKNTKYLQLFKDSQGDILVRYFKCIDREHAYQKEQEYIDMCLDDKHCCNTLSILSTVHKTYDRVKEKRTHTEETKAKMAASIAAVYAANPRTQETVAKWRESVKDYIPTEETKARWRAASDRRRGIRRDSEIGKKISIARMGIEFSDEHREKLSKAKYFPVTVHGVTYSNRKEAMRALGLSKGQLNNALGITQKQTIKISINDTVFETIKDAVRTLGLTKGQIRRRLDNDRYPEYKLL
jgi:group I intron endonuclease